MIFPFKVNVCYLINKDEEVLLQLKRRGFGKGKWNGPGGKIKSGETPEDSVKREVKEETDLTLIEFIKIGELEFIFKDNHEMNNYMHAYICRNFSGQPKDMGEGQLRWFKIKDIPYDNMWEDDRVWVPRALAGEYVNMRIVMDKKGKLLNYKNLK